MRPKYFGEYDVQLLAVQGEIASALFVGEMGQTEEVFDLAGRDDADPSFEIRQGRFPLPSGFTGDGQKLVLFPRRRYTIKAKEIKALFGIKWKGLIIIFHVTLEEAEDGWIVAECPALPGCVSQGK